ncbi:MAG: carboxypeptidase-like regulatory domain-containing protein [Blastocatellia bacterium]|nr:carboxypeptidase-like regulatory domain-containing protein [Blastocatellia bacterium]
MRILFSFINGRLGQWTGFLVGILLGVAITHQPVPAQTVTGTVTGQVIDQARSPLAGVLVRVTNLENGFDYGRKTDGAGNYRIEFLPAGTYTISAEMEGFETALLPDFLIEVNRCKVIKPPPIQMRPLAVAGNPATNVQTAGLTQANLADATLRGSFTAAFVTGLPLAGIRSFDTLALLLPGVAPAPVTVGANGPGIGPGVGTAGQYTVNGSRARSNNFTIDGSDNNDQEVGVRRQGFTSAIPIPVESIVEFQVSTLLADSEAGRNSGGHINVVSRNGSRTLHGELYEFLMDSRLQARDFFDLAGPGNPKKNPATRNQAGGVVSAPLLPGKADFFAGFESQILNRVQELSFAVPTAGERGNALTAARNASLLGRDVLSTGFYPLPNNPGGPYGANTHTRLLPAGGRGTVLTVKVEGKGALWGKAANFGFRTGLTDDRTRIPAVDQALNASLEALTRTINPALVLNVDLSPRAANQFRFSLGRTTLRFAEVSENPFLFQSPTGKTGPVGRVILDPYSRIGVDPATFPQQRATNTFQLADTFVLTKGRNALKFGADVRRIQNNGRLDRNYRAQAAFTPGFLVSATGQTGFGSGVDFAAWGLPSDFFQALAVTPDSTLGLRYWEVNFFVNEQRQVSDRLTITAGLRYERNTVPTDVTGRLERSLTLQDADLPPFEATSAFSQTFLKALNAQRGFLAGRRAITDGDGNNVAVRVGAALDLSRQGRMSLRGGFGLFYDPILGTVVSQSRNAFPNFIPVNFGSAVVFPNLLSANPAFIRIGVNRDTPLIVPGTLNTIGLPRDNFVSGIGQLLTVGGFFIGSGFGAGITLPEKSFRTPLTRQYSVSLEKVIGQDVVASVAYVGTQGRNLLRVRTPNGGQFTPLALRKVRGAAPVIVPLLRRPNRDLGAVTVFEGSAASSYHALQASLARRLAKGWGFQISYTLAHAIDDVSDVFDTAGSSALAQDELERAEGLRAERGNAAFDVRHRLTAAWSYETPAWFHWLKGLRLAGIVTLQTGQPYTLNTALDVNQDGNLNDRLNTLGGLTFSDKGRTRIRLVPGTNPFSLLAPPDSVHPVNGAIGRNMLRAAGIASVDLALAREFKLFEPATLGLRLEAFNLFNRTHFGTPVHVLEAPGFGSATNTTLPARTIQAAIRISF